MELKYLKPKSLTWWAGFVPLIAGVIVAGATTLFPQWEPVADFINQLSGGMSPAVLVGWGAGLIGLRGAAGNVA